MFDFEEPVYNYGIILLITDENFVLRLCLTFRLFIILFTLYSQTLGPLIFEFQCYETPFLILLLYVPL